MGRRSQGPDRGKGDSLKRSLQVAALLLILVGAFFVVRWLFPSDESQIQEVIRRAAVAASVTKDEGQLGRLTKAAELASLCTEDIQVRVDAVGLRGGLDGRDQVRNAGVQLGTTFGTYRIVPANIQVRELSVDQAKVSLTARFEGSAPADIDAQEFALSFRKHGGKWRIGKVETVRLLRR